MRIKSIEESDHSCLDLEGESFEYVEAMNGGDDSSLIGDAVERNVYDRKISASLYAMSISE